MWIYKQTNLNHRYQKKKTAFLFRKIFIFSSFYHYDIRLVVEDVLMSNSSGFNFDNSLPNNQKSWVIWLSLLNWVSWGKMGEFVKVGEFGELG